MNDLDWLLAQVPKEDTLNRSAHVIRPLMAILTDVCGAPEPRRRSTVIGLFGCWGSGKTSVLAMLATILQGGGSGDFTLSQCRTVYVNAWKIAGRQEIIPSIVHAVLTAVQSGSTQDKLLECLALCGSTFGELADAVAAPVVAIKPSEAVSKVLSLKRGLQQVIAGQGRDQVDAYFGQATRLQTMLHDSCQGAKNPVIVMIDELDRCDPDEAYETLRQLRILFGLPGVNVHFIISVNPEPIGRYIRHKFGLGDEDSQFESYRILEKFFDLTVRVDVPATLNRFFDTLMERGERQITRSDLPLIMRIDAAVDGSKDLYSDDTVRGALAEMLDTSNPLYANIRAMEKCWDNTLRKSVREDCRRFLWTIWHLDMLAQVEPQILRHIRNVAMDLTQCSIRCHAAVIQRVRAEHMPAFDRLVGTCAEVPGGRPKAPLLSSWDKGHTAFAAYRSLFYETMRGRMLAISGQNAPFMNRSTIDSMAAINSDDRMMEIAIQCTLFNPDVAELLRLQLSPIKNTDQIQLDSFGRFGYILFHGVE